MAKACLTIKLLSTAGAGVDCSCGDCSMKDLLLDLDRGLDLAWGFVEKHFSTLKRGTFLMRIIATLFATLAFGAFAQPTVVTSIHPIYDLTRQVAGEHADVVRMLPTGASPHTFDPTPRDVARIAAADVVILVGGYGVDSWLIQLVEASGENVPVTVLFDAITFDAVESDHDHDQEPHDGVHADEHAGGHDDEHDDEHDKNHDTHDAAHDDASDHDAEHDETEHDGHSPVNSHIWLDPVLMIQAVPFIVDALSQADPVNADAYRANGDALMGDLRALHEELLEMLEPIQGQAFVPFHDAWSYFAQRYGLDLVVEIEPFPGREPSPAYLQSALDLIAGTNAKAIFTEPQLSRRPAEIVAESAGLPLYILDPLGGTPETERYQDLLRYNAGVLSEALSD
jgi:zinc transport system substrate-binding protein